MAGMSVAHRGRAAAVACSLVLTLGLSKAQSGPAAPPASAGPALSPAQLNTWIQAREREFFDLAADATPGPERPLDPELRAFGEEMAGVLKRRLREAVPRWQAVQMPDDSPVAPLWLHLIEAWAALQVEMMAPALVPAWAAAQAEPRLCALPRQASHWRKQLALVQAVPAAQRRPVVDALRQAVQAFGQPADARRWPERPAAGLGELSRSWRERLRREGAADRVAMSPRTALTLLRDAESDSDLWYWDDRCVVAQAWVQQAVASGEAATADAVQHFLFATLLEAGDLMRREPATPGYAPMARRLGVEASITVEWTLDAQGRATQPRIVKRQLRVPGLASPRALAHESMFDASVSAWVRARPPIVGGTSPQRTTLEFKLD